MTPLDRLKQKLRGWEAAHRPPPAAVSSGCRALDRLLAANQFQADGFQAGGFRRGTLVEFLGEGGSGATALALIAAREACREGQSLVIIDRGRRFYPPAASNFGLPESVILVHPPTPKDELWSLHQALRCQGVGAVLAWPEKIDSRLFRSLQLAAEQENGAGRENDAGQEANAGKAVGFLVRSTSFRGQPSWSAVQLLVEALPAAERCRRFENGNSEKDNFLQQGDWRRLDWRRLRVEVLRSRYGRIGAAIELELNDETGHIQPAHSVPMAPKLAAPTDAPRSARA